MTRGTFANVRIRNLMAPGTEGGVTLHHGGPTAPKQMAIYDAAERYRTERTADARRLRRQGIRLGQFARLGGEGHQAARRPRGDRRELRAHPPQQPCRNGRSAVRQFKDGETAASLGLDGSETFDLLGVEKPACSRARS